MPGRIFEVIPTGTSIQALANTGYLATNDATAVIVTLPATANIRVGETVRVSGSGAAGWIIAQNTNQSILVANLLSGVGVNWTTNDIPRAWKAITSSADGSKLAAVVSGGQIYTSTNYGATWTPRFSNASWTSIASSADGTKLAATVTGNNYVYTSIDSGSNWVQRTASGLRNWTGIASSLDGTRLIACASGGGVSTSIDSGATWTFLANALSWTGVASSANGSNLVAVAQGNFVYVSSNGGQTWTNRTAIGNWTCVASSGDGSVMVAGATSGFL